MKACTRIIPLLAALLLSAFATSANAQPVPETPPPSEAATSEQSAKTDNALSFPVPTPEDSAKLMRYENIAFEADNAPMPDVASTIRAARKGDVSSQFIAHMMYRDNIGDIAQYDAGKKIDNKLTSKEMHREMIRWRDAAVEANYELAILASNPSVQYEISPLFSNDDEFKKGINWLKKAAAHGYGNAEYILGLVYFNGVGIKKDKKQGFELLVRAASHGVINAYYAVAMIYEMGLNGDKDASKSLYWLEKAAHFGSRDAIFILAMKYADGIDVPKDKAKTDELEKLDNRYHVWTKLHSAERDHFYHKYCIYRNDESSIGWSSREDGECGDTYTAHHHEDGFYEDHDYNLEETAASSLDYKIDYRLAALWLKKNAAIERENIYIVRSQAHHLIGCRGGLDGNKFKDIALYPDEDDDDATNFDDSTRTFKLAIIALNDYKTKPAAVLEWLNNKADSGDEDALFTLGNLYEHYAQNAKDKNEHKEVFESLYHNEDRYYPLYKKLKIKTDPVKAFEYYEKANAYTDARRVAILLGDEARRKKDTENANTWYDKAIQVSETAFHHPQSDNAFAVGEWARKTANAAYIKGDKTKAIEWYERTMELSHEADDEGKINYIWFTTLLKLAELYNSDSADVQNINKAAVLYRKLIRWIDKKGNMIGDYKQSDLDPKTVYDFDDASSYDLFNKYGNQFYKNEMNSILNLANFYEQNTQTSPSNTANVVHLHQMAIDLSRSVSEEIEQINLKNSRKAIESLPKLDLQKAVEKQILAEKGKDPYSFFIFNKIMSSCEDEFRKDDLEEIGEFESAPPLDCSGIFPAYQESIQKAMTAITALSIASGSKHPDEIKNTFYFLAIYKGNDKQYREKLKEDSAVYNALAEYEYSTVYHFFYFDKQSDNQLFHIWYLRQIPYAAKDVFQKLKAPHSWDEYLEQARERIAQDENLRTAFGYDPAKEIQKLVLSE